MKKNILLLLCFLTLIHWADAQIAGTVFRDFNGSGTKDNSETGVGGIIINAYNAANSLVTTTTSASNGTYTMPYTVPVRVEFVIPNNSCLNTAIDFTGFSLAGDNIRFVTASTATLNYGILNPQEYTSNLNPMIFVPKFIAGNPLGTGTASTSTGLWAYEYNSAGTQSSSLSLPTASIGSLWGMTYSKQAKKLFAAAFLKRQVGLGPLGSGGIYMLQPTATSFNVTQFYNLDANGYRTRASATAVAYGQGTSYSVASGTTITYLGPNDALTGKPEGLGVIGNNATNRLLPDAAANDCYDPAAFDQIGKVGLGDIEISDDGKFLFVMNLYSRKLVRLELNDAYNPTSVISVAEYNVPSVTATNGTYRPFAVAYQRDKVYIGMVTSGENGGVNNVGGTTDLYAYVFEMNNPTGAASFNTTPVLTFPLNYQKGYAIQSLSSNPDALKWHAWSNSTANVVSDGSEFTWSSPVLSNIDFTDRGDMILDFFDRGGHQFGYNNYKDLNASIPVVTSMYDVSGDILVAGRNCSTGTWTLESAGSYNSNGTAFSSTGTTNANGPGGGEFFNQEIPPDNYHNETSQGAVAMVRGTNQGIYTLMDANSAFSGGTARFSSSDGSATNRLNLYLSEDGSFSKANGLGDIEVFAEEAPIELGNRVWLDANNNGIQDVGESGIANVAIQLFCDTNNDGISDGSAIASINTDANGYWYFNKSNVTDGDCVTAGNQTGLQPNKNYIVKIGSADWASGLGIGDLNGLGLATSNATVVGLADASDNDGIVVSAIPQIVMSTTKLGENNHSYDFGFLPVGSVGNFVWADTDADGIQDVGEVGINGVTVELWNATTSTLVASTTTANNGTNDGAYNFVVTASANYYVHFPTTTGGNVLSPATTTAATNGNSDANISTGNSPVFAINVSGTGTAKDNPTIDAGYYPVGSVGNYVWADTDADGIQDVGETGINGIIVQLWSAGGNGVIGGGDDVQVGVNAITATNGPTQGYYNFIITTNGNYYVKFPTTSGALVLSTQTATAATDGNSDADVSGNSPVFAINVNGTGTAKDNPTIDAGYHAQGSVGNYVWTDTDADGIQDAGEVGINGVTVELWNATTSTLVASTTTANDGTNDGAYNFIINSNGNYYVHFPTTSGSNVLSPATATAATNGNSDADASTGNSPIFAIDINGTGTAKDNPTIDAGYHAQGSVGNYVWTDTNADGIQDAGEMGINGVTVELWNATTSTLVASTTTANDGTNDGAYNFIINSNANYYVHFPTTSGANVLSPATTTAATNGNSDADASTGNSPVFAIDINGTGTAKDNLTIDAGYHAQGSVGNYVWTDTNADGIQDAGEVGINGVTVELWNATTSTLVASTTTANDGTNDGAYNFIINSNANYYVHFPITNGANVLSPATTTAATNGNSDADASTGNSPVFAIDINGTGTAKDNATIDAGYHAQGSVGNYVWTDTDADGIQDAGEMGINGVTVELWNATTSTLVASTTTANDGTNDGAYNFIINSNANYYVHFPTTNGSNVLSPATTIAATNGNSDADASTGNSPVFAIDINGTGTAKDNPTIDAGYHAQGSVGNYVWTDTDADGIQDVGEVGINGVTVELWNATTSTLVASTTTANDGTNDGAYNFIINSNANYYVHFPTTSGSNILSPATTTAATNGNSDADASTGNSPVFAIDINATGTAKDNPTIDAGYHAQGSVGNYVWTDTDADGIQDVGETGINGVTVELWNATTSTLVASTTTANDGTNDGAYNFIINSNANYYVHFPTTIGANVLSPATTTAATNGNSDADASTGNSPVFAIDINGTGTAKDNPTIDAGYHAQGSVGNYVWTDTDADGIQDAGEVGINGVTVELWNATTSTLVASTTTANDGTNDGAYNFIINSNANYYVHFPTTSGSNVLSPATTTAATNGNSDADASTGNSPVFAIDINGTGTAKDNLTIDAGYHAQGSVGNYVWTDTDADGIQDAGEVGINGVTVELWNATTSTLVASTTTANDGTNDGAYNFIINSNANYYVHFPTTSGSNVLSPATTTAATNGNSDADASTGNSPVFAIDINGTGTAKDNPTIDAGYHAQGSVGNYVWTDTDADGIQDAGEVGINGVTVELWNATTSTLVASTTTANDGTNDGAYNFIINSNGNYYVHFPTTSGSNVLSPATTTAATNGNSDADASTGNSPVFAIDINGTGTAKDNPTIDAGYHAQGSVGNYVWTDTNADGIQDVGEMGINGVTVELWNATTSTLVASTTTANDGTNDGAYNFIINSNGNYYVHFPTTSGSNVLSPATTTAATNGNSDADASTGNSPVFAIDINGTGTAKDNPTIDAGYHILYISGNVFDDANGLTDATVNGIATNVGNALYANLLDNSGNVLATTSVAAGGTYSFANLNAGTYSVQLSTNQGTVGNPAPATNLPTNWVNTGENIGTAAGDDGAVDGNLIVSLTTTSVTDVNFGIEQLPIPTSNTAASQVNPGGTNDATVPATTFTATDADGTVISIKITAFPTNATTITINGTQYTSGTFPVGGVTIPANTSGNPTQTILVDPINGSVTVAIPYVAIDNAGEESSTTATASVPFGTIGISGIVFDDANGLTDAIVNGTATNVGNALYANLLDNSGNVVSKTTVSAGGSYSFFGLNAGDYTVQISKIQGVIGNPAPSTSLPGNWVNTGENIGISAGNDGLVDGHLAVSLTTSNVVNVNFGIEQLPVANNNTAATQVNPGGTNDVTVPANTFKGTDADGTITSIKITAFPTNATTITINGTQYTSGTFPITGVTIPTNASGNPTQVILIDPINGTVTVAIPYVAIDNAEKESSNTALASVPFTTLSISGNVFDDANALVDATVNGIATNAGNTLYANLLDNGGNVVATTSISALGDYSFLGLTPNSYAVQISTNQGTVGNPAPATALPSNWVSTGENIGTAAGDDGTVDAYLSLTLANISITDANFGIEQLPNSTDNSAPSQLNPQGSITVQVPDLGGSDAEDGTYGNGASFQIMTVPNNANLYYDGVLLTPGKIINNYDPALLLIDPADGNLTVTFTYVSIDAAGNTDPSPATITMEFTYQTISGLVWDDANNSANGAFTNITTVGENSVNAGGLYINVLDIFGNVIAFTPVNENGYYSVGVLPNINVTLQLTQNPGTIGSPAPATDLPANWVNTSPQNMTFNTGTSDISGKDLGIQQVPIANNHQEPAQLNPGGTTLVSIPATAFNGLDTDGSIQIFTITDFPTNATSISINGVSYIAATFPIGGVQIQALADGTMPTDAIQVDPINGDVLVSIPFSVTDNGGEVSTPAIANLPFTTQATLSLSGTIWHDTNNSANNTLNNIYTTGESSTNPTNALYVNVLDGSGNIIASTPVRADGTYTVSGLPENTNISLQLSATQGIIGNTSTIAVLPSNWDATSPLAYTSFNTGTSNIINKDFGIQEVPIAANITLPNQSNPGTTISVLVDGTAFVSHDRDANIADFVISDFPANATSITINGTTYTAGSFPVSGVTVAAVAGAFPNGILSVDPIDGAIIVQIPFHTVDNAGAISNEAIVGLPFDYPTVAISGTIWNDANGSAVGTFSNITTPGEMGLNSGDLFVNIVDMDNLIIGSIPVNADGTYSAVVPQNSNLKLQLSVNQGTIGSVAPSTALTSGWSNTSPQLSGVVAVGTTDITNQDFGIQLIPLAPSTTLAIQLNPGGVITVDIPSSSFGGNDPDSATTRGIVQYILTDFPSGITSFIVDGITYTEASFPADGIVVAAVGGALPSSIISVDPLDSNVIVIIPYKVTDNAGSSSFRNGMVYLPLTSNAGVFPVTILNFTANWNKEDADLAWVTTSELNTLQFEVERSLDGILFERMGAVKAAGNSSTPLSYSYKDKNVRPFVNTAVYYRLKTMDFDGTQTYSNIVELNKNEQTASVVYLSVYPNPAISDVNIVVNTNIKKTLSLTIINGIGQVMYQDRKSAEDNVSTWTISVQDWSKGFYYIDVTTESTKNTFKFFVE